MLLEKGVEYKMDGSSEEQRSLTHSQRGKEHPAYNKKKEGKLDWSHLVYEMPLEHVIAGQVKVKVKVKQSRYRPRVAQRVPGS